MKCVKCGKRKGKRGCPALGGDICSECCGTHRLKEIACPASCSWLGGLAVVAGLSEPPPQEVRAAIKDACASIGPWLRTYARRQYFFDVALDEVFGDDNPETADWLVDIWLSGIHHGVVDEKGRRLIEIMLGERAREMAPATAAALRSLVTSWFSVFRVERVDVDAGVLLRDTIDDREIYVHEKSGTHYMKPLDVVMAFISTTGGVEMFQGVVLVPPAHVLHVIDELRSNLDAAGSVDRIDATPLVWGWTLGRLRTLVRDFHPQLQNTDGEMLLPSKARFDVLDEPALRRALTAAPDLNADSDGWGWRRGDGNDAFLSLGHLSLDHRGLILEVNSRERLERGKALVTALAGAAVKHRIDEHMDVDQMIDETRRRAPMGPSVSTSIPEDVQREVVGQALRRAYANYLDEPIPALGNQTPRRAARASPEGKQRVRVLLDGLEQSLLSMPGASDAINVDEWRVALGIEPRSDDSDDSDDSDGPAP
ncbi:MAG: hypothetical protein Q8O67_22105 [Deltaproteobacteria bacterium]|nr:hypothetical protein [Deltaproteobacteria bacterium]